MPPEPLGITFSRSTVCVPRRPNEVTICCLGDGVAADPKEAAKCLKAAAYQGEVRAAYYLAEMYLAGVGVRRDRAKAFTWARAAAEAGDIPAQELLAGM